MSVILAGTSSIDQGVSQLISYILGAPPWAKAQCSVAHLHHCSVQICLSVSQSIQFFCSGMMLIRTRGAGEERDTVDWMKTFKKQLLGHRLLMPLHMSISVEVQVKSS